MVDSFFCFGFPAPIIGFEREISENGPENLLTRITRFEGMARCHECNTPRFPARTDNYELCIMNYDLSQ